MKEFNLTEYLKDPSKKVVTRDGREVRIICTDMKSEYPLIALVTDKKIAPRVHLFILKMVDIFSKKLIMIYFSLPKKKRLGLTFIKIKMAVFI